MNFWNKKNLQIPPINTYKAANETIDIKHMYDVLKEGKLFFDDNKYMHAEYVVLSRIVYRMKQKFRTAKDFKALEKVHKALDNYWKMNISLSLKKFMGLIPFKYKEETYLPTKNLLDYILVRLQGLAKLMERIVETSKIAAYLLDKRIHTGHFWKIAFIIFALVSRVYVLAKYTTKFICEYYQKLLPFSHQLKNTGRDWLPENYILPKDLKEWINVDWLEFDDDVQIVEIPSEIPDIIQFFDLVNDDDDDVQFADEYFVVDDDVEIVKEFKKICNTKAKNAYAGSVGELRGFDNGEDIGEVIEINDSLLEENSFPQNVKDVTDLKGFDNGEDIGEVIEINDSLLEENSFPQGVKDVTDNSVISIMSDMDKSDVIDIADSTLQSELEEGNILHVSDMSLVEIMDEDDSKSEASNVYSNHNNVENKFINTSTSNNLENNMRNDLLVSESEHEFAVTEVENIDTVCNGFLIEIEDVKEVKMKKTCEIRNGDKLENNLKLPQMENDTNETNIKTNSFLKSSSERRKSEKENIVILSDISVIEVTDDKIAKKERKLIRESNNKFKNEDVILSPETGNFIIESDEDDVIIVSDTSILRTTEDRVLKKKIKRSNKKGNKLLNKVRSVRKSNSPLILNPALYNITTQSSEKSITSPNTILRDNRITKKKKKNLKQKPGYDNALMNVLVKNNAPAPISNENHNTIQSKHGETNNTPQVEPLHSKKIKRKKNKLKQSKPIGNLEMYSQFQNEIKPHSSSILVSNLRDNGFKKNVEGRDNNVLKRKNKLSRNSNNNNKVKKKFKLVSNDVNVQSNESISHRSTKVKINKFKKATENGFTLEDKLSKNKSSKMDLNSDILLGSQMQNLRTNKKLAKKHEENVTLDTSVMKIVRKKLKKKRRIRENSQNNFGNTKTNSSFEVVQGANKQTKTSAENLVSKLNQAGSSNKFTKVKDKKKSTHEFSTMPNFQNKIKNQPISSANKLTNYENHSVNIWSATAFDINSRKRKIKEHENEPKYSNKKRRKNKNINKTQLLGEISSKEKVKGESNKINSRKLNKKKKKLKLLNKLTRVDLQEIKKSPKLIDKLKRNSSSSTGEHKKNKRKKKRKNIDIL